jgi:hypothetical protein
MPVITSRLREPIIIFRLTGDCTSDEIQGLFRERLEFLKQTGYPMIYSITDTTHLTVSDERLFQFLTLAGQKRPGTAHDDRIVPLLSGGTSRAVELYRKLTVKPGYNGIVVPTFDNVDQALQFARWHRLGGI